MKVKYLYVLTTDCWSYVTLDQDPDDDRIITFNDGYWHYLRAERDKDTASVYLDTRHKGWQVVC